MKRASWRRAVATARAMTAVAGLWWCAAGAAVAADDRDPAAWQLLSPSERVALAPLQREWPEIDASRRQKWREMAARFSSMSAEDRARVQARMADWARMTPTERGQARLQYQEARRLSPGDRQARWEAYRALPDGERQDLARRAPAPAAKARTDAKSASNAPAGLEGGKRNIVGPGGTVSPVRAVAPTVIQARPGATTTLMSSQAAPPAHHQPGLPKIAATTGFVNPSTLLPQRGPQGAAVRAAATTDPASQP